MRRYQKLARRKWRFRLALGLPIVILVILASAVLSSGAWFTASSANPSNIFTAGVLSHGNSNSGSAILTADLMKPGDTASGTVTITNDGNIPGTFSLSTSDLVDTAGRWGGNLSNVLQLRIVDPVLGEIYNGLINAVGTVNAGTFAAGEARAYEFTVTFPDAGDPGSFDAGDNVYQKASMSIQFNWAEIQ